MKVGDHVRGISCDIEGCEGVIFGIKLGTDGETRMAIRLTKVGNKSWHGYGEWQVGRVLIPRNWGGCLEIIEPEKDFFYGTALHRWLSK